jgi:uncharacterized protein
MYKFVIVIFSATIVLMNSCDSGNSSGRNDYYKELAQFRFEKNNYLKHDSHSPLTEEMKDSFDSLSYFPINTRYRVVADFIPIPGRATMEIPLNNGEAKVYQRFGFATFTLDSIPNSLLVLRSIDGNARDLFVPFFDKTNGFETYGGGRYLEAVQISDNKIVLDFNRAYNPFCAYSPEYICPLPPRENSLHVAIKAGEKSFEKY